MVYGGMGNMGHVGDRVDWAEGSKGLGRDAKGLGRTDRAVVARGVRLAVHVARVPLVLGRAVGCVHAAAVGHRVVCVRDGVLGDHLRGAGEGEAQGEGRG